MTTLGLILIAAAICAILSPLFMYVDRRKSQTRAKALALVVAGIGILIFASPMIPSLWQFLTNMSYVDMSGIVAWFFGAVILIVGLAEYWGSSKLGFRTRDQNSEI